jgi:hypothetical protein
MGNTRRILCLTFYFSIYYLGEQEWRDMVLALHLQGHGARLECDKKQGLRCIQRFA